MRSLFRLRSVPPLALGIWVSLIPLSLGAGPRLNVLFIAVDDLRPQIHNAHIDAYRTDGMVTPHLDRLFNAGMVFDRAFCQIPVCGASRLSILTGTRPFKVPGRNHGRFWSFNDHLDAASPTGAPAGLNHPRDGRGRPAPTLPQIFRDHGYATQSIGKIYHHPGDDPNAWTEGCSRIPDWRIYHVQSTTAAYERGVGQHDTDYPDGKNRQAAIQALRGLAAADRPFFLALGFAKPHLPFNCPAPYWDLYDRSAIQLADNPLAPAGAPRESLHTWGELRSYEGLVFKDATRQALADDYARTLIHGYYACVSYVDTQIGAVLDELDRLGLRDKTVVVLWGDHGWNLGEHNLWCKHCLYETSLRVPLVIDAPGHRDHQRSPALVEYVDVYPTLCDLAGIALPDHLEGTSLVPLLDDPRRPWKGASFSNWQRGRSVRTARYRYSEFYDVRDRQVSCMLYDHDQDPLETVNVAEQPERAPLVRTLQSLLHDGWTRAARPDHRAVLSFDVRPDGRIVETGGDRDSRN